MFGVEFRILRDHPGVARAADPMVRHVGGPDDGIRRVVVFRCSYFVSSPAARAARGPHGSPRPAHCPCPRTDTAPSWVPWLPGSSACSAFPERPDYRHAGLMTSAAMAEPETPSRVVCSDLSLGFFFVGGSLAVCLSPSPTRILSLPSAHCDQRNAQRGYVDYKGYRMRASESYASRESREEDHCHKPALPPSRQAPTVSVSSRRKPRPVFWK